MFNVPIGFVERLTDGRIIGWGVEDRSGKTAATIHLFVDDVAVDVFTSVIDRPDVSEIGLPGKAAGFEVAIPQQFRDGQSHDLHLRFDTGGYLSFIGDDGTYHYRSTFTIDPDPMVEGHADGLTGTTLSGWAVLRNPLTDARRGGVSVLIRIDGTDVCTLMADTARPDIVAAFGGDGLCGFDYRLPIRFRDPQPHHIEILVDGTTHLVGSPFTLQVPPELQESRYVSINPAELTRRGRVTDDEAVKQAIVHNARRLDFITEVGELFPAYSYPRPDPNVLTGGTTRTRDDLLAYFGSINRTAVSGGASQLVRLQNVYVHDNQIHHIDGGDVLTLYETARANDRAYVKQREWDAASLESSALRVIGGQPNLYIGSVGYSNYGHWLIDDLPRIAALRQVAFHANVAEARIVLPGTSHVLDAIKEQSIRFMKPDVVTENILHIPVDQPVFFDVLYYASPVSDHPVLKSPRACEYLRVGGIKDAIRHDKGETPDRIFIDRRTERGRKLINRKQVAALFIKRGFVVIDPETIDFADQVRLFRGASFVAGCMGAAMTNTVFCASDTDLLYLVPDGWMEPFYWDLAAVCGHRYNTVFGASTDPDNMPHKANYKIDVPALGRTLDRLLGTTPARN